MDPSTNLGVARRYVARKRQCRRSVAGADAWSAIDADTHPSRLKSHLFRDFLGHTTYDLLLRAHEKGSVLTFPFVAHTLLQLGLGTLDHANPMTVGAAHDKPTFSVYSL